MAGITTARDVGSSDFIDVGLRNAVAEGVIPGPRMLVSERVMFVMKQGTVFKDDRPKR